MEDAPKRGRGRGRGSRGRGRGRGRARGRAKKPVKVIESDEELDQSQVSSDNGEDAPQIDAEPDENAAPKIDLEADISQLEAPTFTTINRGPPEPMLRLDWSHKVNLIGEKVLNPMIHCCDKCLKPILIYGRMIPCKHVFCLACGKKENKQCPRCGDKVTRVEQTGLGTVFMCTHEGTRYGTTGCRRTYLSQRDLQAHINHRHVAASTAATAAATQSAPQPMEVVVDTAMERRLKNTTDPRAGERGRQRQNSMMAGNSSGSGVRTNLITVQIQDSPQTAPAAVHDQPAHPYYSQYPQSAATLVAAAAAAASYGQPGLPPMHLPPPQQAAQYYGQPSPYGNAAPQQQYNGQGGYQGAPTGGQYGGGRSGQYDYAAGPPPPQAGQWSANNQNYYR